MTNEKLLLNYLHELNYQDDPANVVGPTTSLTLRTIPAPGGDIAYVRKFGTDYLIKQVTGITDPIDTDLTFTICAADGTILGSRRGGAAFAAGSILTTAQPCYMVVSARVTGGATMLAAVTVNTDVDPGGLIFTCPTDTLAPSEYYNLYLSDTGSTYYDEAYMYGGARHTPALNNERKPYFTIATSLAACASAHDDGVEVLDSAEYDEELTVSLATFALYATAGQTPTLTAGIGARASRAQVVQGNNTDTCYVSKSGDDGNAGTYQSPYLTLTFAIANRGARTHIKIMDSGIYLENITLAADIDLEPLFGFMPKIVSGNIGLPVIDLTHTGADVYGITIDGATGPAIHISVNNHAGNITDNTTYNHSNGIVAGGAFNCNTKVLRNISYNSSGAGIYLYHNAASTHSVQKNIVYACDYGIIDEFGAGSTTDIQNNVVYNCSAPSGIGIMLRWNGTNAAVNGNIKNNTIYGCTSWGIAFADASGGDNNFTGTISNNISKNNGLDLYKEGSAVAVTITYTAYSTNTGFVIGAGCITTDVKFCKETTPYKLGLSANSPAYRTGSDNDDMGARLRIIIIGQTDIEINGFFINGKNQYNNGIIKASQSNLVPLTIRWNDAYDCQGIDLDIYDNDADTDATITNNKIHGSGNGLRLARGGNSVSNNLIYGNSVYGLWCDYTGQSFSHNVFMGNQYGLYAESSSAALTIIDNIFSGNMLYGIYSEVIIIPSYCCINDAINGYVDISDGTNIETNPLFIDADGYDYHIMTIEAGSLVDSPCKNIASDGYDIGAYLMTRGIASEAWRKYQLAWNPRRLDPEYNGKGVTAFETALGVRKLFEKSHKRIFPLQWDSAQASTEELWKKIQFLSSLVPDRDQGRTADQCRIRLHPLPDQLILDSTGDIDAATKTIADDGLALVEDELKGYWAGVKYYSADSGAEIVSVFGAGSCYGMIEIAPGPGWENDELIGCYFYRNGYYYYIYGNQPNEFYVYDPNCTLVDESDAAWNVEKYFKIVKNESTVLHLQDDSGELPMGEYDYYVDFIEVMSSNPQFKTNQPRYYWQQETWKTGFSLTLEEI